MSKKKRAKNEELQNEELKETQGVSEDYNPEDVDVTESKNYLIRVLKSKRFKLFVDIFTFPLEALLWILDKLVSLFKFVVNVGCLLGLGLAVVGVLVLAKVYPTFQEARETAYDKLANVTRDDFQLLSNTVIYDKNGKKIGEIKSNNFKYKDIQDISMYIQNGYIATEDKNFKTHCGIDLQAITRAGFSLIKNNGEITQGGSTITQQVVKNVLLTQEQTYTRKIIEVLIAPDLEKEYSKTDIMEFYCNTNYYGNQCYGVESASKFYFGKSAKDLTLSEAATICGISNAPNDYNPVDNYELAIKRRNVVLDNMLKGGYITKKECKKAKKEEIVLADSKKSKGGVSDNYMVSYAIHCVTLELMKQDDFKFKYTFDTTDEYNDYVELYQRVYSEKSSAVRAGGYKIYTSFDRGIQKKLQEKVDGSLSIYTAKQENDKYELQGSAVCIDNSTGLVVAMVGGRGEKDEFNRAFLAQRQPGSTIKPLLDYAPAIDIGAVNGSTVIKDEKIQGSYSPTNSGGGYSGNVTVRQALAKSINTVAYKLFTMVGSKTALSYLDKMHFSSLSPVDNDAVSISLGGFTNGLTVVDMAKGYYTLENGGIYNDKTCLVKVDYEKSKSGTIYDVDRDNNEEQVYNEDTAFIMTDIMQGTLRESGGTAHSRNNTSQIYAGKTGTTSDNKDAWFCGFSKYYTTSVWIGCDTPKVMSGMYGGTKPLEIWSNFMNELHADLEKQGFDKPSTVTLNYYRNGKFADKVKTDKDDDSIDLYAMRKGGMEWYSDFLSTTGVAYLSNVEAQSAYNKAVDLVKSFEKFSVGSLTEALQLDDLYKECMDALSNCSDQYDVSGLKKRAKDRYDLLNKTVVEDWAKAISEYNEGVSEQQEKQNKIDADNSKTAAQATLRDNRVAKVEWYIGKINGRSYYNDITKLLIKDAKTALSRCEGYSDYDSLKSRLNSAESYAKNLPTEPEHNDIPEDSSDRDKDYQNDYKDEPATTTQAPTTTEAPTTESIEVTTEVPTSIETSEIP